MQPILPSRTGSHLPRHAGRRLGSPLAVVVLIPALVLAVGGVVYWLGSRATERSALALGRAQLAAKVEQVSGALAFALGQSDAVLEGLRQLANPELPRPERIRGLVGGRPGVVGVATLHPGQPGQGARGWRARVDSAGAVQVGSADGVSASERRIREGGDQGQRLCFAQTGTNVSVVVCGEVGDSVGDTRAVVVVEFDVAELVATAAGSDLMGTTLAVLGPEAQVLTQTGAPLDPNVLAALGKADAAARHQPISVGGAGYMTAAHPLGGISGLETWQLVAVVPSSMLLGEAQTLGTRTALASLVALVVAVAISAVVAWNFVRMRDAVGRAQAAASRAEARALELGSYRLVEKVGGGGMGEVWRAEHRLLARRAAIKLLRPEVATGGEWEAQFGREAQSLASLRSRNTIELYDYGVTDDGTYFIVMEFLDGTDLSRLVKIDGPQPWARVVHILRQVCQSLAEAHDVGLVHRDIKPANVFLAQVADELDVVKVLDFGIAAEGGAEGVEHGVFGTPGFIPPERLRGGGIDARGDLYALGCVAWTLLTGRGVFSESSDDELAHAHVYSPVPSLADAMPKGARIPSELDDCIRHCLAKEPAGRPQSAREVAVALSEIPIPADQAWNEASMMAWWAGFASLEHDPLVARVAARVPGATRQTPVTIAAKWHGPRASRNQERP